MESPRSFGHMEVLGHRRQGVRPCVAALGVFDGVHRGHQNLISQAVASALGRAVASVVVTFDPHPLAVVGPRQAPPVLTPISERARLVGRLGADALFVLTFDERLQRLSPSEFVAEVLAAELGCEHVVVGSNFRFGAAAAGDTNTMVRLGAEHGIGVSVIDLVTSGGAISSTRIRSNLAEGAVDAALDCLGRPFRVAGATVPGSLPHTEPRRTVTIAPALGLAIPGPGVYRAVIRAGQRRSFPATVEVGDGDAPLAVRVSGTGWAVGVPAGEAVAVDFVAPVPEHEDMLTWAPMASSMG